MKEKQTLGIFIDGQLLRLARLRQDENETVIEALETTKLVESFDRLNESTEVDEDPLLGNVEEENLSPFGLDSENNERNEDTLEIEEASTNFDVVMDVISKMCSEHCDLAFNLLDSSVTFKELSGLKQQNHKKKAKQEFQKILEEEGLPKRPLDTLDLVTRSNKSHLGIMSDDPLEMVRLLNDIQRFTRQRPPHIKLIDSAEIAIAGAVRSNYELGDDEITAIVMICNSYSKIFFMRGSDISHVVPTINKGSSSPTVCEVLFSKLLFEMDTGHIDKIDRFVLIGEADRVDAENFFHGRFQKVEIERLQFDNLTVDDEIHSLAPELILYAPAIALALKGLNGKSSYQFETNFIPDKVREQQSMYRIAWHGNVLLVMLFMCVLFLTYQSIQKRQEINLARLSLREINAEINGLANVRAELDSIQTSINNLEQSTALLDSLSGTRVRWSPTIEKLADAYTLVGGFNTAKITTTPPNKLVVEAESNNRDKVADLERFMANSNLQSVLRVQEERSQYLLVKMETEVIKETKPVKPEVKEAATN